MSTKKRPTLCGGHTSFIGRKPILSVLFRRLPSPHFEAEVPQDSLLLPHPRRNQNVL